MKVIVTGPESTGKSELVKQLAQHYSGEFIPEYARQYIGGLSRDYTYNDVEHIAQTQLNQMQEVHKRQANTVFFDTYLIITKVWMKHAFQKQAEWIDAEIAKTKDILYLLCWPDIPWEPDTLRENGGEMRNTLFSMYEHELQQFDLNYRRVEGIGHKRLQCTIKHIDNYFNRI